MLKTSRSIAATTVASSYPMSALPAVHQLTNIKTPRLPRLDTVDDEAALCGIGTGEWWVGQANSGLTGNHNRVLH